MPTNPFCLFLRVMAEELWNHSSLSSFILAGLFGHSPYDSFFFSLVLLAFGAAVVGNILLLMVIQVDRRLHTPMYFFLSQLSLMDLMLVCNIVPKMAVNFLSGKKSISFVGCGIQIGLFVCLVGSEGLLLGLMAYDRYVAISHPLRYPVLMNQKVCLQIIGSSWAFGIADGLVQMVVVMTFPYCSLREVDHFFCELPALLKLSCADTSAYELALSISGVLILLLPLSLIFISYGHVLGAVLHMRSAEARHKAFTTCSSHVTVVGLFFGAAVFIYMVPGSYHSPKQDNVVSLFYSLITPTLNPLIYSLRNREVRMSLVKFMGRSDFKVKG